MPWCLKCGRGFNMPQGPTCNCAATPEAPSEDPILRLLLDFSRYLHTDFAVPSKLNGKDVGMMECKFDQHGQLAEGPFYLSQDETDEIVRLYWAKRNR